MELDGDGVAEDDLGGVAEEVAGGVGGDGVAAFEDAEGAAFFELEAETLEALAFGAEEAFGSDTQFGGAFFEAQAERGNFHAEIKCGDAQVQSGEAFARLFEACAKTSGEARRHLIGALALLTKQIERAAEGAAAG